MSGKLRPALSSATRAGTRQVAHDQQYHAGGTDAGGFNKTSNCGSSRKVGWDCTITARSRLVVSFATSVLRHMTLSGVPGSTLTGNR
jgi:hypothetical protein